MWGSGSSQPQDSREMIERMTAAQSATVDSGVRYMRRWSELSAEVFVLTSRAMTLSASGTEGAKELGTVSDELYAAYRMMAELPLDESRQLQIRLGEIWRADEPEGEEAGDKRRTRLARIKNS